VFAELLREKLAGIWELSDGQVERLQQHHELLMRWNERMNLTSIRDTEASVERHYCESIFLAGYLPAGAVSVADVGSGAGFPGIPIAIVRPDCRVSLIECQRRKAVFLREGSRHLGNVRVIGKRAEDVNETFDWLVSRAVRLSEIGSSIKSLGRNVEILTGEVRSVADEVPGFSWAEPIRLPWGERRFLWTGTNASRST
jgi:16S rRNA (guanine527-N7)-methyltransferase